MIELLWRYSDKLIERVSANASEPSELEEIWFQFKGMQAALLVRICWDDDTIEIIGSRMKQAGTQILQEVKGRELGWSRVCLNTQGYYDGLILSGKGIENYADRRD